MDVDAWLRPSWHSARYDPTLMPVLDASLVLLRGRNMDMISLMQVVAGHCLYRELGTDKGEEVVVRRVRQSGLFYSHKMEPEQRARRAA